MSRIGKKPIAVPAGVEVKIDGSHIAVKGPKGQLTQAIHPDMILTQEGNLLHVQRPSETKQHKALLETEGVEVEFTEGAIDEIATMSYLMNEQTENIGARRLHTVLEKLLEDISFNIPDVEQEKIVIDADYVKEKFQETIHKEDLDRFIL